MAAMIGTLKETSLHAALKSYYARDGDRVEVQVDNFWVDVLRDNEGNKPNEIVEIQTGNFSALKRKLASLLDDYLVTVVYPIAQEKVIVRVDLNPAGEIIQLSRRKSPKRGRMEDIFDGLVYIPRLINHPQFQLEAILIREEQFWHDDGRGSWRRRGVSIIDRRMDAILGIRRFSRPADYLNFIPANLAEPFTTKDLAVVLSVSPRLARKMVYTLKNIDAIRQVGKRRNSHLYVKTV